MTMACHLRGVSEADLEQLLAEPRRIHELVRSAGVDLVLERTWHGLHFLLCGEPWGGFPPLDFIMSGGEPIGDEDVGHGPARGFTPMEVRAIAVALGAKTFAGLWERWDPDVVRAADLYEMDLVNPAREAAALEAAFDAVRGLVTSLGAREMGLLVFML